MLHPKNLKSWQFPPRQSLKGRALAKYFCMTAGLLLTGCMVGPDYKEPYKPVAEQWKADNDSVTQEPYENGDWWEVFHCYT